MPLRQSIQSNINSEFSLKRSWINKLYLIDDQQSAVFASGIDEGS